MKPIRVGLLGLGTVGSGTFQVLQRNQQEITRRAGRGIEITLVAARNIARAQAIVGDRARVGMRLGLTLFGAIMFAAAPWLWQRSRWRLSRPS